jgi:hypothetical protein
MDYCTGNIRQQFKGKIESNRIEYQKLIKEIDKLDLQIKSSLFPSNNNKPLGDQKYNILNEKLIGNTNNLIASSKTANEIEERDKLTAEELKRQGNVLMNVRSKIDVVESNLTLIQQINDIMNYSDLFYRFKLVLIAIGLFFAIVFVLYMKIK